MKTIFRVGHVIPSAARNLLFLLLFLIPYSASAQFAVSTGTPPFGSFGGGPDVVNLGNNNAHLSIPVLHKAGRGQNFQFDITYDSSIWFPATVSGSTSWVSVNTWGWQGIFNNSMGYITFQEIFVTAPCNPPNDLSSDTMSIYTNWAYTEQSGTVHTFLGAVPGSVAPRSGCSQPVPPPSTLTSVATDGSGYTLSISSAGKFIYSTDGKALTLPVNPAGPPQNWSKMDRNGNIINGTTAGQYYDTLNSTTQVLTQNLVYTAPSGAAAQFVGKYTTLTVQTSFGCSGISEYGPFGQSLLTEIDLPDYNATTNPNSRYLFTYEPTPGHSGSVTGRLASVTLPTGGTITYSYSGGSNGIICSDGSTATLQRVVNDGRTSGTWTYARSQVSGNHWQTTITDPANNQTVIDFQQDSATGPATYLFFETQRRAYQGSTSGTLLQTINTCYNGASSPCTTTSVYSPIAQTTAIAILPGASNLQSKTSTLYDTHGNVTEVDEYDFGSGAPPSTPLRKSLTTYASLGNNISNMPSSVVVQDGSGNVKAKTTYAYDETSVTATTGTPQHNSVTGSRGNATTIKRYKDTTNFLTTTATYFDTGNVKSVTDVNGGQTTSNYSDSTSTCGNSFPTTVTEAISTLSKSMTWNCTGAVQLTAVDENGKTTQTSYSDAYFWRPASVTDPTTAVTNTTYSGPTSVESTLSINSNSIVDSLATLDGLGRSRLTQTRQSPGSSTFDTVQQDYDNLGRPSRSTLPFAGSSGQTSGTAPAVSTTYDALGRPFTVTDAGSGTVTYSYNQNDVLVTTGPAPSGENTKRRQLEYDGLGRLISVCELTTATGSGTCGQIVSQTGFWTKYSYDLNDNLISVTQNAQAVAGSQQTRSYTFDFLSRLTSETNPESGTTTYSYDVIPSGCANAGTSSAGDMTKKADAAGHYVCPFYDALHRVTDVGSDSGCKRFRYDNTNGVLGSKPSGVSVSNTLGRLAEAETDSCAWPITQSSIVTDEWLSYTVRGEASDFWESTPHSGGYLHTQATYWPHGLPNTIQEVGGSGYWNTYSPDGEGRVYSTGNGNLTSASYNSAGQPTQLNFGSGDNDVFGYDSNTGRMSQFKFNVGSTPQSVVGNLTWNANGTLAGLTITDPFNSANTQSCGYAHDDLLRIANVNCGPNQNQWNANGGSNIFHQCGRADGDGWSVNVSQDPAGCYMQYGPYYTINSTGTYLAQWTAQVDNNSANNATILHLDVYDDTTQTPIASMDVTREQFAAAYTYQTFSLPFTVNSGNAGHTFEFRMYWYGYSYVKEQSLDYASNSTWSQTFSYDPFGNITKSGSMSFAASYSNSTNRMTSVSTFTPTYDANGNVLNDGAHTYTWDAYGNSTTADGVGLTFDALDRVVEQNRSGNYTQIEYSPTGFKMQLKAGQAYTSFVPLPGGAMAIWGGAPGQRYRHPDWLGTARLVSTQSRAIYYDGAYGPFGEPYALTGTTDLSFTGQNSDTASGLYDFLYRPYGTQGRWPTPDSAGLAAVDATNPQSWNRYAYVTNNPLAYVDPLGLDMSCLENVISGYNGPAGNGSGMCGPDPDPGLPPGPAAGPQAPPCQMRGVPCDSGPTNPLLTGGCSAEYQSCTFFPGGVLAMTGSTTGYVWTIGPPPPDSELSYSYSYTPVNVSPQMLPAYVRLLQSGKPNGPACRELAARRAYYVFNEVRQGTRNLAAKSALKGAIGGAIISSVMLGKGISGAIPGAAAGGLGGALEGAAETHIKLFMTFRTVKKQYIEDIAACGN